MKKIISLVLAILSGLCLAASVSAVDALPFEDVESDSWYHDDIARVSELGIMFGRSPRIFSPKTVMTRAEFVTMLTNIEHASLDEMAVETDVFTDVSAVDWCAPYIGWAVKNGIVTGYTDGSFRPNAPLSRQELAVMIVRFMDLQCFVTDDDNSLIDAFADASSVGKWARPQLERLRLSGIINGDENGRFNPTKYASRAECAAIAVRYYDAAEAFFKDFAPVLTNLELVLPTDEAMSEDSLNGVLSASIDASSFTRVAFKDAASVILALGESRDEVTLDCVLVFTRRDISCEDEYKITFKFADDDEASGDDSADGNADSDSGASDSINDGVIGDSENNAPLGGDNAAPGENSSTSEDID